MLATTAMLWVISTIAVPSSRLRSRSCSRICAWTVTSSAVVGSSAMSTSGSFDKPIAIIARCRIPPENWWGYSWARRSGSGMRTRRSSSGTRLGLLGVNRSWAFIASSIW